jgi:hypothetical protein
MSDVIATITVRLHVNDEVDVESSPPGIPFEILERALGKALDAARKIRSGQGQRL